MSAQSKLESAQEKAVESVGLEVLAGRMDAVVAVRLAVEQGFRAGLAARNPVKVSNEAYKREDDLRLVEQARAVSGRFKPTHVVSREAV